MKEQQDQQYRRTFFSEQNESMLYGMLSKNFQQRLGSQLNEKQSSHLERGLEFYMSEVFQAKSGAPIQSLNKEVLSATASEFTEYLQRQELVTTANPQMFQDASQRFDRMQQDRQRSLEAPRPTVPDYVQSVPLKEDDSISAMTLFEEAKKRRNLEMNVQADAEQQRRSTSAAAPIYLESDSKQRPDPRAIYDKPLDLVVAGQSFESLGRGDGNPTIARPGSTPSQRGSLQQDMLIKQEDIQSYKEVEYNLSIYSADRKWEMASNIEENRFNFSVNLYSGNSPNGLSIMPKGAARFKNIVRIEFVKAVIPIEVTEMIVRKVSNATNPDALTTAAIAASEAAANNGLSGAIVSATATINAMSVLRSYQTLVGSATMTPSGTIPVAIPFVYDTAYLRNIFAYPFVTLNISELDTNTYGTSTTMDNAFGILQYDSNWTDNTTSLGFTSLIPKHMKCQRVYSPTPLATLNKMSIRLQQPNGSLVNSTSDTIDISGIALSDQTGLSAYFNSLVDIGGTPYYDNGLGEYIFIDCKQWFTRYQYVVGDTIQIRNVTSANTTNVMTDFLSFLQRSSGHTIVGTAYTNPITQAVKDAISYAVYGTNTLTGFPNQRIIVPAIPGTSGTNVSISLNDGCNTAGYARFIIIRGRFADPTSGLTQVSPYGNITSNTTFSALLGNTPAVIVPGKLINLSRQTQFIFRIVTREYDSTSLVRPDNL